MEISRLQDSSIKIKTKTVAIVVEPTGEGDGEVVILTDDPSKYFQKEQEKLIVRGPGDYEVSGVTISGERKGEDVIYKVSDGNFTVIVAQFSAVNKVEIENDENISAVVLGLNSKFDEGKVASLTSSLILLYGKEENAPASASKKEKVNLKKRDELEGNIVYLSK